MEHPKLPPFQQIRIGEKRRVRNVNGTARVVPIPPKIGEKREVRDVNETNRVVTIQQNIDEKMGGQGRQQNSQGCPHPTKYR